jgi:hypothetical protein
VNGTTFREEYMQKISFNSLSALMVAVKKLDSGRQPAGPAEGFMAFCYISLRIGYL